MKLSSILIPVILLAFLSCNNDDIDDLEFCNSITQGNYLESLSVINDFVNDLNYEDSRKLGENSNMEILADWLEQKPCISDAEINCFWCAYSLPPKGSIVVNLVESTDTLVLGLIGTRPITASSIIKK